jgi:hypothetical protein
LYRGKDKETGNLFSEIFPFGGSLEEDNQWIKLSHLIPWDKMEVVYAKYFSEVGRPGKDSRLITGLMIIKHRKGHSDRELVEQFLENPYLQYFCGYDHFVKKGEIHYSTLSKLRKRLGAEYFKEFEKELLDVLVREKVIKPRTMMLDATVCPANITYPTDIKLLNVAREWLCEKINWLRKAGGIKEKVRTYRRKARKVYLAIQKKKRKSKKAIEKAKKSLLRYVRRNLRQFEEVLEKVTEAIGSDIKERLGKRFETARQIYRQQKEMVEKKVHQVQDRIVSFHWPEVRPMVRGKDGKEVEFGPKAHLSLVDGFTFLDKISYDAYNESGELKRSLKAYRNRFGKLPEKVTADRIYGTRWNRKFLKRIDVNETFQPLGRASLNKEKRKEVRKAQKKRNRIEGVIGWGKDKYQLDRVRYRIPNGAEMWVRMGLVGMNLTAALKRI